MPRTNDLDEINEDRALLRKQHKSLDVEFKRIRALVRAGKSDESQESLRELAKWNSDVAAAYLSAGHVEAAIVFRRSNVMAMKAIELLEKHVDEAMTCENDEVVERAVDRLERFMQQNVAYIRAMNELHKNGFFPKEGGGAQVQNGDRYQVNVVAGGQLGVDAGQQANALQSDVVRWLDSARQVHDKGPKHAVDSTAGSK